jgi:hypothetical protein
MEEFSVGSLIDLGFLVSPFIIQFSWEHCKQSCVCVYVSTMSSISKASASSGKKIHTI